MVIQELMMRNLSWVGLPGSGRPHDQLLVRVTHGGEGVPVARERAELGVDDGLGTDGGECDMSVGPPLPELWADHRHLAHSDEAKLFHLARAGNVRYRDYAHSLLKVRTMVHMNNRSRAQRLLLSSILSTTTLLAASVISPPSSNAVAVGVGAAVNCSVDHCYAILKHKHWVVDPTGSQLGTLGAGVNMMVECMQSTPPAGVNFVNQEMWVGTDGTATDSWVEVGMTIGYDNSGAGMTKVRYFWADQRPAGGYHEYNITTVPAYYGNTRRLEVKGTGRATWKVYIDGTLVGTSTSNPDPSEGADAGEEATYNTAQTYAKFSNFQYYGWDKKFHSWTDKPVVVVNPPLSLTQGTDGSFTTLSDYFCSERATLKEKRMDTTKADALGIAKRLAADNADAHPSSTRIVATQRSKMKQQLADGQQSTDPLWVVEMIGHFVGTHCKAPTGLS